MFKEYCWTMAGWKSAATALTPEFEVGEYAVNMGKDADVGNGCAKGAWNVAPAFGGPMLTRDKPNGAESTELVKTCPVGRE
jgi:hypothetical protein